MIELSAEKTDFQITTLLTEMEIMRRVRELGMQIARDYPDSNEPLLALGVLKGATLFLADLARAIPRQLEYDFISLSSYGAAMQSSGEVCVRKDLEARVAAGKHVLIVEDILDTGTTLHQSRLFEKLLAQGALSVKLCALLDKPSRRLYDVPLHYRGFEIEDKFVVGYGMDYAEQYRNLSYIGVLARRDVPTALR